MESAIRDLQLALDRIRQRVANDRELWREIERADEALLRIRYLGSETGDGGLMAKTRGKSARLLPYFGSNTENAEFAGSLLDGCRWVGIPFGGGMSEVPHIKAGQILVSDVHRHVVNLCRVISCDHWRQWLIQQADAQPYHPDTLAESQSLATTREIRESQDAACDPAAALWYFTAAWMGRGGKAGTNGEFKGALPIRWNANGGGSNRRYRTAIEALDAWGEAFRRCEFVCLDWREFLEPVGDDPANGLYCDPPWVDAGAEYAHSFTETDHRSLATTLPLFLKTRVVVRYGDNPLIRELYPECSWRWIERSSRDQANHQKPEVYLVRNG